MLPKDGQVRLADAVARPPLIPGGDIRRRQLSSVNPPQDFSGHDPQESRNFWHRHGLFRRLRRRCPAPQECVGQGQRGGGGLVATGVLKIFGKEGVDSGVHTKSFCL